MVVKMFYLSVQYIFLQHKYHKETMSQKWKAQQHQFN